MQKVLVYLFVAVIATYLVMALAGMTFCLFTLMPGCRDSGIGEFLNEALAATLGLLAGNKKGGE